MGRNGIAAAIGLLFIIGLCVTVLNADAPVVRRSAQTGGQTADMPDSWLVLYNLNDPDSVTWANWYQQERSIPAENMVGLAASLGEHLPDLATVQAEVITPVRDLLGNNPTLNGKVMGIIVGYGLPGHYADPESGPGGGYSVADAFEEIYDDTLPPLSQRGVNDQDNPQFQGNMLPPGGRLTKATMEPNRFMVARIDGPTLADAMALTTRAKAIEDPNSYLWGQSVWYDYTDCDLLSCTWQWLKFAVEKPELAEIPWTEFDADNDQTPNDAMRFGTHDLVDWDDARLRHPNAGSRILAFNFNSYGATTVRSTTADGARYVPNALDAGYAAAIGATGEPSCCQGPVPETILAALREGWTLGESFHICAVWDDWMWTLVGDPFLTIPHWFDELPPPGDGDMNSDGLVNGLDVLLFMNVLTGADQSPSAIQTADLSGDGAVDDDDAFLFIAPSVYQTYDYTVLRGNGDASGDGRINGRDIAAFLDMVFNGTSGYSLRSCWGADINMDDAVTLNDLAPFVQVLLQGGLVGPAPA